MKKTRKETKASLWRGEERITSRGEGVSPLEVREISPLKGIYIHIVSGYNVVERMKKMKKTREQKLQKKYFQLRQQISLSNMLAEDFRIRAELCERAAKLEGKFPEFSEAWDLK